MRKLTNAKAFAAVRVGVGLYTIFFYLQILSSPANLFVDQNLEFFKSPLPLPSLFGAHANWMQTLAVLGLIGGSLLTLGIARRIVSPLLLVALILTLGQNWLLHEVHNDYYGWTLLLFTFVAAGEPWSIFPRANSSWSLPNEFYFAILICFGGSYSLSGLTKLLTPEWNSGLMLRAYHHIGFENLSGMRPSPMMTWAGAWIIGVSELLALPLVCLSSTRLWIWLWLTLGQVTLAITGNLQHISIFMIVFHLLLWQPEWLPMKRGVHG